MKPWFKFPAWLGAITVVCWLWGFVPEWRVLGTGWNQSTNEWFEQMGLRTGSAVLLWLVLAAAGYHAFFKRPAA